MSETTSTISKITLSINELNTPIKTQRLAEWVKLN